MKHIIIFVSLLLVSSGVLSRSPQQLSRSDSQANFATGLFMDSCLSNLGKPKELAIWIKNTGLQPIDPSLISKALRGENGEVWSATNPIGEFLLIVNPINVTVNKCAVLARRANVALLVETFEKVLKGVARPGLTVNVVSDHEIDGAGGKYHQLVYEIKKDGSDVSWTFIATTTASEQAEIQARLTVSPAK